MWRSTICIRPFDRKRVLRVNYIYLASPFSNNARGICDHPQRFARSLTAYIQQSETLKMFINKRMGTSEKTGLIYIIHFIIIHSTEYEINTRPA